jgi:hypothetical protein
MCQYPGLKPFLFGNVVIAGSREESEARPAAEKALDSIFPIRPGILHLIPGALFFTDESE